MKASLCALALTIAAIAGLAGPTRAADPVKVGGEIEVSAAEAGYDIRVGAEDVDASDLLHQAVESCAAVIVSTGTEVRVEIEDPVAVVCDPSLIHPALVNVVRNACEAAAEFTAEPRVTLSTLRRTTLGGDGKRVSMRALRVADNGPGVPPEVRERMFNPFFTTRNTGTGLVLAIVHRILDAHAGRVEVRNNAALTPGARGAFVELWLPARPAASSPSADPLLPDPTALPAAAYP